jgi:hypothetical protein
MISHSAAGTDWTERDRLGVHLAGTRVVRTPCQFDWNECIAEAK